MKHQGLEQARSLQSLQRFEFSPALILPSRQRRLNQGSIVAKANRTAPRPSCWLVTRGSPQSHSRPVSLSLRRGIPDKGNPDPARLPPRRVVAPYTNTTKLRSRLQLLVLLRSRNLCRSWNNSFAWFWLAIFLQNLRCYRGS